METLNEDVFLHIFSYVTFKQRVQCEVVCKLWRRILMKSYFDVKTLSLHRNAPFLTKLSAEFVEKFFQRLAYGLEELYLDMPDRYLDCYFLNAIQSNCLKLKKLHFIKTSVPRESFQSLFLSLTDLEHLSLNNVKVEGMTDNGYQEIVEKLPNLTQLSFRNQLNITGEFLINVPNSLNSLSLGPNCLVQNSLYYLIEKCRSSLTSLNIEGCSLYANDFRYFCERNTTLTKLNVSNITFKSFANASRDVACINFVGLLRNLGELHAGGTELKDEALNTLAINCVEIRILCLKSMNFVTDLGLVHLSKLKRLEVLDLSNNARINDWSLIHLISNNKNLRRFYLCGCAKIVGNFLSVAFMQINRLEFVGLCECRRFSDEILNAQLNSYSVSTNEKPNGVTLSVRNTGVTLANVFANNNLHSLMLNLDFSECDHHERCCSNINYDYFR